MPENSADLPDPGCFSLHPESGIEENQSVGRDLVSARAPARERDRGGRFAEGHSGNPKGRPRGIPNPKRRAITLQAWRANPQAASTVAKRRPWLLRPLLMQVMPPPVRAQDPAERLGVRPEAVQMPEEAGRVSIAVWAALARGEIGTGEAAHIARRVRARLRLQRHCNRLMQRHAAE
jgi:hypothetical protein